MTEIGPNGEVRRGDAAQRAVQVMRIATGQEEEEYAPADERRKVIPNAVMPKRKRSRETE